MLTATAVRNITGYMINAKINDRDKVMVSKGQQVAIARLDFDRGICTFTPDPSNPKIRWAGSLSWFELGSTMTFTLTDKYEDSEKPPITGTIKADEFGIEIRFDGYGMATSEGDEAGPVLVEFYDSLRVVVWPDINEEDPQVLDLAGAYLSRRQD